MDWPKGIVILNRETGLLTGKPAWLSSQDQFYRHARLGARVWRYMDGWKFERILSDKALYFRRSDRLEDEMEGKYAEANRNYTTKVWRQFTTGNNVKDEPRVRDGEALQFRHRAFINCWHVNRIESPKMWKDFCKTEDSLAIVSTVRQITTPLRARRGFAVGRIRYESQSVVRPEWSRFAPLFFKDPSFYEEKEYRLVVSPYDGIDEDSLGVLVPIEPGDLVNEIFLHPNASDQFALTVKALAKKNGIKTIHKSRLVETRK